MLARRAPVGEVTPGIGRSLGALFGQREVFRCLDAVLVSVSFDFGLQFLDRFDEFLAGLTALEVPNAFEQVVIVVALIAGDSAFLGCEREPEIGEPL
ncbi:hypothetical protein BRC77_12425 [Halobacteriales archaeon QH_8_64_26]|jgi:hypothetical protein|nr:MAG: hypothetical protein BRC77_12425 [Halobacteriales archaeon QH_8_64_26]